MQTHNEKQNSPLFQPLWDAFTFFFLSKGSWKNPRRDILAVIWQSDTNSICFRLRCFMSGYQ